MGTTTQERICPLPLVGLRLPQAPSAFSDSSMKTQVDIPHIPCLGPVCSLFVTGTQLDSKGKQISVSMCGLVGAAFVMTTAIQPSIDALGPRLAAALVKPFADVIAPAMAKGIADAITKSNENLVNALVEIFTEVDDEKEDEPPALPEGIVDGRGLGKLLKKSDDQKGDS